MAVRVVAVPREGRASYAAWDALFIGLSVAHAAALVAVPSVPLVAVGLWWNANTIAHNFIHRPFFRGQVPNRLFAVWLSAVLGVPQSVWRDRHLRHHREAGLPAPVTGGRSRRALPRGAALELVVIIAVWAACLAVSPRTFLTVYVPGYACGLAICFLQGHFEHAGGTTSHYGRIYNLLFFNDGYHVEHHRRPGLHWTELSGARNIRVRSSPWPAALRWLDACNLDSLERLVLGWPVLQRFVLDRHERAFRALLPVIGRVDSVTIVGGGLFPRTAIVLRRLIPDATITIVDSSEAHLALARPYLSEGVRTVHAVFDPWKHGGADLLVVPLAYRGDRDEVYGHPPGRQVIVHDWIWARRPHGVRVSWLLLKRLNLVRAG